MIIKRRFSGCVWLAVQALLLWAAEPSSHAGQYCPSPEYPDAPVECVDNTAGMYWCCPEDYPVCGEGDYYGYCMPDGTSTTTVPAAAGGDYIAVINLRGSDSGLTQSSGTLPGTGLSVQGPELFFKSRGSLIPDRRDRRFEPVEPLLIQKTREALEAGPHALQARSVAPSGLGEERLFWVQDDLDQGFRSITATCMKTGDHSCIFVENGLPVPDAALELYVTEFETMHGLISDSIGDFIDRDGDSRVAILLYDMNDSASIYGTVIFGYFWEKDYLEDPVARQAGLRSNEADMIYMRGDAPDGWGQLGLDFYQYNLTTLIHEYQHLVHFGIKKWVPPAGSDSDIWINEMMSMAAETMYFQKKIDDDPYYSHPDMLSGGYLANRISFYNQDSLNSIRNGHGLTFWDSSGDVAANYALAYIFGQYLSIHSAGGSGIFKDIIDCMLADDVHDYRAVERAASRSIAGIGSWENLLTSWAIANLANQDSGLYGYEGAFVLTPFGPTRDKVAIYNGGIVYRRIDGAWTAPPDAGPEIAFVQFSRDESPLQPSTTTAPASSTTTTTSVPEQDACAVELALGNSSGAAGLIRRFRDDVLTRSRLGNTFVRQYYLHSAEVCAILEQHPELRRDAAAALEKMQPAIMDVLEGRPPAGGEGALEGVRDVCGRLAELAGPELASGLEALNRLLHRSALFQKLGIGLP